MIYYAIGDVHGRDDLLEAIHRHIAADREKHHAGEPATLVHVGDYVDRGPDSIEVIDRLMAGVPGFRMICLKGNHEAMMLTCTQTDDRQAWMGWLKNGGDATIRSLDLRIRSGQFKARDLVTALGDDRLAWLEGLPLYHATPDYLFVHAGILPGTPIEQQRERDLLWIRYRFLESDEDHGRVVVHGHTPMDAPDYRDNRIGIDTGAFTTGHLTAVILGGDGRPRFMTVEGEPGEF